jgi:hypothetical protein
MEEQEGYRPAHVSWLRLSSSSFPSLPAFPPDNLLSKVSPRNIWEIELSDWCRMLQVSLPSLSLR